MNSICGIASSSGRTALPVRTRSATKDVNTLTAWAVGRGIELESLTLARPSLEDVYLDLAEEPAEEPAEAKTEPKTEAKAGHERRRRHPPATGPARAGQPAADPITLILSIGFPLLFFFLIAALVGNETLDSRNGVRLAQFLAPGFASIGVVMATFSFLAVGFAEARSTGELTRQNGTPLPRWALLGGAALLLGLTATTLVPGAGMVFYDVQLFARSLAAVIVTLVLSAMTFSALGLAAAVLLPTPQATLAVTNGIVIPISFFSNIFLFSGSTPGWMSTLGWLFPLKHLVNVFADALNPRAPGME